MFVSEIFNDLKTSEVLGSCDDSYVFARLSDAQKLVANMGIMNPAIGEMSLCVCDGCVTLPNDVDTVLGVNQGGFPTLIRDEWFRYHANGPGDECWQPWNYTDVRGQVCTWRDPSAPVYLIAEVESPKDSNKMLRVYGWDENGKRIYTTDSSGNLQDGFLVPTVYGFAKPNPEAPAINRIDRIHKDTTNGFIKLLAINADGSPHTQIGYYRPEETVPSYVRIRVANKNWLKIKYKKKSFDVTSVNDWINVDNREVLVLAVKAVQNRRRNNIDLAGQLEAEASRILTKEVESKRPPGISPPQVVWNEGIPAQEMDRLFY
jgi:hypothetical protein